MDGTNASGAGADGSTTNGGTALSVVSLDQSSHHTDASQRFLSSEGSVELNHNGCCIHHPFVQLQRRKSNGGGWHIMSRTCALCAEEDVEEDARWETAEREEAHREAAVRRGASGKAISAAASVSSSVASKAAAVKDKVKDAAASVMSSRFRRGSSQSSSRDLSKSPPLTQAKPHPLEQQHSLLNTTSRRSMILEDTLFSPSSGEESIDSSQEDDDNESITPSFLETDEDEDSLSVGSSTSSCCLSKGSVASTTPSESIELNSLGEPITPPPQRNIIGVSGHVPEQVDEQRSVFSRRSRKSHKSHGTSRIHDQNSKGDKHQAVQEIILKEISVPFNGEKSEGSLKRSKKSKRSTSRGRRKIEEDSVDMIRVESALRKIKSIEKIQQAATSTVPRETVTSKTPRKKKSIEKTRQAVTSTVTSETVTSKSVNSNQQQLDKMTKPPKSPRPPRSKSPINQITKRNPPPPPPRRNNSKIGTGSKNKNKNSNDAQLTSKKNTIGNDDDNNVNHDMKTAVPNPHPEPELPSNLAMIECTPQSQPQQLPLHPMQSLPQMLQQPLQSQPQQQLLHPMQLQMPQQLQPQPPESFPELQVQGHQVENSKEWMKYSTGCTRREQQTAAEAENGGKKKSKFLGRSTKASSQEKRPMVRTVKQMPFTDQFGDFGFFSGNVDEQGRPDGKGSIKYENGVFYEGTWAAGCQDKLAASQYGRIRGGFTSWSGKGKSGTKSGSVLPWNARKNDAHDAQSKTNTRGMEWVDLNGDSGRYSGEINNDQLPHGNGIMRYDFGLIAEGEWVNGVLKEGPQDRMIGMATAMNGGQSVAPGMAINSGMSVGPGAGEFASGAVSVLGCGGISVAPPGGFGGGMGGMMMAQQPPTMAFSGMNPMMSMANQSRQASQHAMIAHQNLMMKSGMGGGVYGGAGSVYGGGAAAGGGSVHPGSVMPLQHATQVQQQIQQMPQQQQPGNNPPVSEIKLS